MGKIQIITEEQQIVLDEVKKDLFVQRFYFTGGTALSAFYLQHRYSEDLDFFTENKFDQNTLLRIVDLWSKKHDFTFTSEFHEVVYVFMLKFNHNVELKVDFGYYPYRRIEKDNVTEGLKTDSLIDIAVNKLLPIPPLDGSKVFSLLLPEKEASIYLSLGQFGMIILLLLLFFPIGGFSLGSLVFNLLRFAQSLLLP